MMKKKIVCLLFAFLMASSVVSFGHNTALANDDITGIKLEIEMRDLINRDIMKGYGEGIYKPGEDVTRGQFAALISRALDLPAVPQEGTRIFPDVPQDATLAQDIYRASEAGLVNGYTNGKFGMNDLVTREQMAQIIDNALDDYLKVDRKEAALNFIDKDKINVRFTQAVARNVHDGIINGFPNEDGTFQFAPQKTATRAEAAAFISRMLKTAEIDVAEQPPVVEKPIEEPVKEPIKEPVEEINTYKVATIDGNKNLVPSSESYATYDEAKNVAVNSNQVITFNGEIIKMSAGLAISNPPTGSYLTYLYEDSSFKKNITYINAHQEMEYIESTDQYVKVNLAGKQFYAKQSEILLIPYQQVEKRNYYSVNNKGELVHYLYNQINKSASSYVAGKAPSFITAGNTYYSWDGGVFYNTSGKVVGTAYQYFNNLPARTVSSYTAEELDQYIDYRLAEREALYTSNSTLYKRYKDATKISKIKGLGTYLKEAESKYKVNALMILSIAIHESDFGMSTKALEKNNLFGIKAYDSNGDAAEAFASPNEAIDGLVLKYLNLNYINPTPDPKTDYANGAVVGNKSFGFNVKYASDPNWGQKVAGHMYTGDQYLGGKDFGKYRLGKTTETNLNVRHEPVVTSSSLQFTYKRSGMPVAILDSSTAEDGSIWYKVLSDHNQYNEGYINSIFVSEIPLVK